MSNIIAIVGRPNVGKSALFNRIIGRRIAIVHDQPGVTRDRISAEADWHGQTFTLIDTGGIGLLRGEKSEDAFVKAAIAQVNLALETAHLILFVVNAQEGLAPAGCPRSRLCDQAADVVDRPPAPLAPLRVARHASGEVATQEPGDVVLGEEPRVDRPERD